MAVYALYVPTTDAVAAGLALETFANLEVPQRVLKDRTALHKSDTWYLDDDPLAAPYQRPKVDFSTASKSGYLLVWKRKKADPVPDPLSPPDEEWWLSRWGRVQRAPWRHTPDALMFPEDDGTITHHPPTPPTTTPGVRGDVCDTCWQLPPTLGCDCAHR